VSFLGTGHRALPFSSPLVRLGVHAEAHEPAGEVEGGVVVVGADGGGLDRFNKLVSRQGTGEGDD
jgi:hypothetical protein